MKLDQRINLRIPSSIHAVLAQRAKDSGYPLSEVVRQAMRESISDLGQPRRKETH